jgi:starch synthase
VRIRVAFAAAELAPFASTGGLGEVAAALPRALSELGHEVSVFAPLHALARRRAGSLEPVASLSVPGFPGRHALRRLGGGDGGPRIYFVEHEGYFGRLGLYGDASGDFPDNLERFAFFSRAVLEAVGTLGVPTDVLHLNDWHTALAAADLRSRPDPPESLRGTAIVFTIHNLAYQGRFPRHRFAATGLPWSLFCPEGLEFFGEVNCLKGGIVFADAVTTVSPRYAREILTPEFGEGLDGVLRWRRNRLHGILNGIDVERWNPETDPHLPAHYGLRDLSGKALCREALLRELGLQLSSQVPLAAMVTRLAFQKGSDLVLEAGSDLLRVGSPPGPGLALVLLGSGDPALEEGFRRFAEHRSDRVAVRIGFDESLAHRILAGADMILVPSRYEPCGLSQMQGLRYGTVPVVRACGGLDDTVVDVFEEPERGTGFKFGPASVDGLFHGVARAVATFRNPAEWRALLLRGMAQDFSWRRSARRYADLYQKLLAGRG